MVEIAGSKGYAEKAQRFAADYESVTFEKVHNPVRGFYPGPPATVLDIGAGTGRDAAALSALGYQVDAVEPTAAMREQARLHHAEATINWIADSLPELTLVRASGKRYDLILLTAVWMHLQEQERLPAMQHCAGLLARNGIMSMSLRHGPVPAERHMFDIPHEETIALGSACGLQLLYQKSYKNDTLGRNDISWSYAVFRK